MQTGRFSEQNLFLDAAISGPALAWSVAHPLTNLLKEHTYVKAPARCLLAGELSRSWFELTLPVPRVVDLVSLFFHSLSLDARYRLTATADVDDVAYEAPTLQTDWRWVYPSLYDPAELEIWQENFITGTVTEEEARLLRRHLFGAIPDTLVQRLKVEFDDQANPAGSFDLGGIHGASGFSPEINFDRGHDLAVQPRDLLDEAPSGQIFAETRTPRRILSVNYSNLLDAEARRFVDASLRARSTGTVLFIPNLDDPAALMREAFPANFGDKLPGARISHPGLASTALTLREILA